jgi:hypothetical protein
MGIINSNYFKGEKLMGKDEHFYLGKIFDLKKDAITDDRLTYDPPDLTTHAIVTGMTGSGKTGLCIGLLEEAAIKGIPAIIVDPKGDLTNLVLSFPDLAPSDFEPWIDADSARREKKSISEVAEKTATLWRNGLKEWGLGTKDIQTMKNAADRAIYTPGSTIGKPVNILASFAAPKIDWGKNEEILREKISSTVTALLTLVGLNDIDPLRSREHILLANIIEHSWQQGTSLDMVELIRQTQNPPFDQLGAFSLNDFFPKKDRSELAMLLNNFLASPSFQSWIEGESLDIERMLYSPDGKPCHSIFYLAHLDDTERMFFVTLLYAAIETWMRKQRGSGDLRALVYFDEIHGYLPPVFNPPSKPLFIRLLKTARAFGVGLVLTTQNPVDLDYKALSNAGTWLIGRLQTDQDKQRLLDGLEGAAGGIKRSQFDKLISSLGKRVFLYHNVHEKEPSIFHTRWVMNFLAGPLTLSQIPALNTLAGAQPFNPKSKPNKEKIEKKTFSNSGKGSINNKIKLPGTVQEYFFSSKSSSKITDLSAALIAVAEIRYLRQRPPVDFTRTIYSLVNNPRETGQNWESAKLQDFNENDMQTQSPSAANFSSLSEFMASSSWWSAQEKEFEHWIYETDIITLHSSKTLGVTTGPEVSASEFLAQCKLEANKKLKNAINDLESKYKVKANSLEGKIERQELKVNKYKKNLNTRGFDTALKLGESLFNFATKGKLTGVSSSSTKVRMTAEARSRLKEAENILENYQEDLKTIMEDLNDKKIELKHKWEDVEKDIKEIKLTPTKQNIRITHFGILWKA